MGARFEKVVLAALRAPTFRLTVVQAHDVLPTLRRVRFHAPDLVGSRELPPGSWLRLWVPSGEAVHQRAYTFAGVDVVAGTFDVELVLHTPDGVATRWARGAQPGDLIEATLYYGEPFALPTPLPAGLLLVGDPASLPAINEILAAAPADLPVTLVLEDAYDWCAEHPVAAHPRLALHRVERTPDDAALLAALDGLGDLAGWTAWVALESGTTRRVRTALRGRVTNPKRDLTAVAYWIHGRPMGTTDKEPRVRERVA